MLTLMLYISQLLFHWLVCLRKPNYLMPLWIKYKGRQNRM